MFRRCMQRMAIIAMLVSFLAPMAEAGSAFTARRTFGVLFLSGSALMAKKAIDFKRDADKHYDAYKLANNARDAELSFNRASDRDTKSQMSIGLSAIFLVSGLRLLMHSGIDDNIPKSDRHINIDVTGDIQTQSVGVALQKRF